MFNFFKKNDIGEPPWDYNFLINLPEKEYPKYLAKIFKYRTGEKLPLKFDFKQRAWVIDKKRCKTFNQKIQWIKLYGVTDLMRMCTDKVAVRDYVAEKIGSEYLKPVLQIIPDTSLQAACHCEAQRPLKCRSNPADKENLNNINFKNKNTVINRLDCHEDTKMLLSSRNDRPLGVLPPNFDDVSTYFDQIQWDKLPNAFVIKCNHGCKWQYIIKNKKEYLNTPQLFEITKRQMTDWLEQEYFPWNGFEMQYNGIKSKIIIEELMREEINIPCKEIEVYCFCDHPKIIKVIHNDFPNRLSIYDEKLKNILLKFSNKDILVNFQPDEVIKDILVLSQKLCKNFNLVRIDWLILKNKIYFNELTFTPNSGFMQLEDKWNLKLGNYVEI